MAWPLRQILVASSPLLASFSTGGSVTFPTLLIEQLKNDTSIQMDTATKSWIGSIYGWTGIPAIFMPLVSQTFGRKFAYILACSYLIMGYLLSSIASSIPVVFISETFHGLAVNCLITISMSTVGEMLSPKYRSRTTQAMDAVFCLGMATSGIVGRFVHFRIVSLIMLVPISIAGAIGFLWPESPSWLAWKGELDKCEKSFLWLRGKGETARLELNELLLQQRDKERPKFSFQWRFWETLRCRDFYLPCFHIFILMNMMYWSGGDVIFIYFMEMVRKTTGNEFAAKYSVIVMYAIVFTGSIVSNFLVKHFKNKTVLLFSTGGVIVCLFGSFVVSASQAVGYLSKDTLVCVYFLIGFSVFNSFGLNALVFTIGVELMPVKHRGLGGGVYIMTNCVLYASTQKISPYLFQNVDMWVTFLIFTMNCVACAWYVWKYVPETKGKTLQEIEHFYTNSVIEENLAAVDDTRAEYDNMKSLVERN